MIIQCVTGGERIDVPGGQDPHAALDAAGCGHCADAHGPGQHCGEAGNMCARSHPGPCWDGAGPRPDGCTVCRPIRHTIDVVRVA